MNEESNAPDPTNINANTWQRWLEAARRTDHNTKVKQAIKGIKPKRAKSENQMQGVPTLFNPPSNPGDDSDPDLS